MSIAGTVITALAALGSSAGDGMGHVHGLLGGIAIMALLRQGSARAWFARPSAR
ncbi:hypothetical protein ACWGDE_07105 [Streptomyces sp. NPDC054956]